MKFFGKEIKEYNRGYFGIRRCTVCNNQLRDVDLADVYERFNVCFLPLYKRTFAHILVCKTCNAYMEIDNKLWTYYAKYLPSRFNKNTTDEIMSTIKKVDNELQNNGVKLNIDDTSSDKSLDLIYKILVEKYGCAENIEEIISVFYN